MLKYKSIRLAVLAASLASLGFAAAPASAKGTAVLNPYTLVTTPSTTTVVTAVPVLVPGAADTASPYSPTKGGGSTTNPVTPPPPAPPGGGTGTPLPTPPPPAGP